MAVNESEYVSILFSGIKIGMLLMFPVAYWAMWKDFGVVFWVFIGAFVLFVYLAIKDFKRRTQKEEVEDDN